MMHRRGFTLVVVVVIVLVVAAVTAGVLSALRGQTISALKSKEDAAARGIAETCADRMFAYATSYIKEAEENGEPPTDFDHFLDPDGNPATDDGFIPGGGATVYVPQRHVDSPHHRYALFRLDGGACLIRFDDNSDDWHPGLGLKSTSNNGVVEGPNANRDVPERDRDRSIWVSVIGVYPAFDTTDDTEVWQRAHARIGIRRFLETAGGPAVWAGDRLTINASDTAICGLGGMVSQELSRSGDRVCACGHQKHRDINVPPAVANECDYTSGPGDNCDDRTRACEPNLREVVDEAFTPQGFTLPTPSTFRDLPRPIAKGESCAVWLRTKDAPDPHAQPPAPYAHLSTADGEAFVWLADDVRIGVIGQLTSGLGLADPCTSLLGQTLSVCGAANTANSGPQREVCAASPPSPMPRPCRYTSNAQGALALASCAAEESRCWLPIARLDGSKRSMTQGGAVDAMTGALLGSLGGHAIPVTPALSSALLGDVIGVGEQSVVDGGVEFLSLQENSLDLTALLNLVRDAILAPLPPLLRPAVALVLNAALAALNAVLALGPVDALAGIVTQGVLKPVSNLLFMGDLRWSQICGAGSCVGNDCVNKKLLSIQSGAVVLHEQFGDQRNIPRNVVLVVENGVEPVRIPSPAGLSASVPQRAPLRVAVRSQGAVEWSGEAFVCCPTCSCPAGRPQRRDPNSFIPPLGNGAECDSLASTLFLPDSETAIHSVLHADGACRINGNSSMIGRIQCSSVNIGAGAVGPRRDRGGCFIGGVDGRAACDEGDGDPANNRTPCAAPPLPPTTSVCLADNGCDDLGVCVEGHATIVGNVRAASDVCLRADTTVYGQVVAGDDVALHGSVVVNHDNAGSLGAVTQAQAWQESLP